MQSQPKVIVLDDDPTGSQTVHGCLLLTQWDVKTLTLGLQDESPLFFILTNTRAMTAEAASQTTRSVCQSLKQALEADPVGDFMVVSRSDSTLRGHYPIETDVIAEELGPFDAHFLVPAFLEGGRITRESVHYLRVKGQEIPVHETEFARDSVFAYHHSYLPDYVAEKTNGRIPSDQVQRFLLPDLRSGCQDRLNALSGNACGVVDAEIQSDLNAFAQDILAVASQGKRFLFRSAASLLTALANLPPQPVAPEAMAHYVRGSKPGAVIVGSHVRKTTEQLQMLLEEPGIVGIEVEIERLLQDPVERIQNGSQYETLLAEVSEQVERIHLSEKTPVIYTSRDEIAFDNVSTRLQFGQAVSALLMDLLHQLPRDIGFLISKGGITSNDTLSVGLRIPAIRLLGQIAPGCSVVKTPSDHDVFPDLPVVLFPGNVGDADTLALVYRRLSQNDPSL